MTGIIDYGVGNLFSLLSSLKALGEDVVLLSGSKSWERCSRFILPGVGSFIPARKALGESGLEEKLREEVKRGKPLLGICLGMQLLFEKGYEEKECCGLSFIPGSILNIRKIVPEGYKIPHIGWNGLHITKSSPLLKRTREGECVYFVHSYYASTDEGNISSVTDYGVPLTASVEKDNVYGVQFHPEKSGKVGLDILSSFLEIE